MQTISHTYQERFTPGHFGPHHNVVIEHEGQKIELEHGGGSSDHITVINMGQGVYYVLSVNYRLPYVGMSVYDVRNLRNESPRRDVGENDYTALSESGSVFLQGSERVEESLGHNGMELGTHEMAEALAEYCY